MCDTELQSIHIVLFRLLTDIPQVDILGRHLGLPKQKKGMMTKLFYMANK